MKYYVYLHVTEDTGEIFYVGKGSGNRWLRPYNRNRHWKNVVAKHGFKAFKVALFEHEQEALDFEHVLIETLGLRVNGGLLVNSVVDDFFAQDRSTPEWQETFKQIAEKNRSNPERSRKLSEAMKKNWEDPEFRSKYGDDWRTNQREAARRNAMNPEWRAKVSAGLKGKPSKLKGKSHPKNDPHFRDKMVEVAKKRPKIPCEFCGKVLWKSHLVLHGHIEGRCIKA